MLFNYFKTGWRNIRKHAFHSALNIFGLAIGILFTLLIGIYVWMEMRVNEDLRNSDRQYFLQSVWKDPNLGTGITTATPLAPRLREKFPDLVANYYRWDGITSVVSKGDKFLRQGLQVGDSTMLSMFGFTLLHGNAATALKDPYSVILTRDKAKLYFGRDDVVGETITIQSFSGSKQDFRITGVLADMPRNTVTQINDDNLNGFFIPLNTLDFFGRTSFESWSNIYCPAYIELQPGVTLAQLEPAIRQLLQTEAPPALAANLSIAPVSLKDFYRQNDNGLVKRMLFTLSFAGLFILLMAIINFINIAISGSSSRIREIGIRKVLGSGKRQLVIQFLTESTLLVFVATAIAIALYPLAKPMFEDLIGKQIPSLLSFSAVYIIVPLVFILIVGIASGIYPALSLSQLNSVQSVKGKLGSVYEKVQLRKVLTGLQFCIAAVVLIAAVIVSQQTSHFFSQSLGFDKDYVVSSQVPRDWSPEGVIRMSGVRDEFARLPEVRSVALSYEIPNGNNGGQNLVFRSGSDSTLAIGMSSLVTDGHYPETYGITMAAGTFYAPAEADLSKIVINETAARSLGWKQPQDAVGADVRFRGAATPFRISGVVRDFHFGRMSAKIAPLTFVQPKLAVLYRYLSFKLKAGNVAQGIAAIEKKWAEILPGSSFEYTFMDDSLHKLYASEIQMKKAAYLATALALIIVLLGVLGLISLSVRKRMKEISIRKVLGASGGGIISLFIKEFLPVMLAATCVAIPVAWYILSGWLSNYEYRIKMSPAFFILPVALLLLITILVISVQIMQAAARNPVRSLRAE